MFAGVLPGIRELRVPLAGGFLWLALVWVWVGVFIPLPKDAEPGGFIEQFYRLAGALGTTAMLAALVFVAYLIGVLLQFRELRRRITARGLRLNESNMAQIRTLLRRRAGALLVDSRGLRTLLNILTFDPERRSSRRNHEGLASFSSDTSVDGIDPQQIREDIRDKAVILMTLRVLDDIPMTAVQLQVQQKDLYADYDRAHAEGEFRLGVAAPLGAVILAIGIRMIDAAWWAAAIGALIGASVFLVLVFRGIQKHTEANDVVVRSIVIGAVDAPIFALIDEAIELKNNTAYRESDHDDGLVSSSRAGLLKRLRRRLRPA